MNCAYRPHFAVDNYLELPGAEFMQSDLAEFDSYGFAVVKLLYDGVNYSKLIKNTDFRIIEGGNKIVGIGCVSE